MGFLFRQRGKEAAVEELVKRAQAGDQAAREQVLSSYTPFVLRVASRTAGKYLQAGRDDEVSVGLMALNEAIDHFDGERRGAFLGFAETVIRRRLVDYFRREGRRKEILWSALEEEDDEGRVSNLELDHLAVKATQIADEEEERREEIARFNQLLQEYGLSLSELAKVSPKHRDARSDALALASQLARNHELMDYVRQRKALPMKDLEAMTPLSRKTLDRQRKYILAVALAWSGDFPHLQSYLRG